MPEQTSYSQVVEESSSQEAAANCWLAVEVAQWPAAELVVPMEVAVDAALDPSHSQAGGSALVEPMAVGAEVEEALGPMGLNWPVVELELAVSRGVVSEAGLGSSLTVVAAEQ